MSSISKEDKELWLSANKGTRRLKNQDVNNTSLNKRNYDTKLNNSPLKKQKNVINTKRTVGTTQLKKSMQTGQFSYEAIIDLHDMTLEKAHKTVINFISDCYHNRTRYVIIITGHGGGYSSIKQEFCFWLMDSCIKNYIVSVNEAHIKQGGSGAYYIIIKRKQHV